MAVKYDCVACRKQVTGTKNDRYRTHTDGNGDNCEMSSVEIPEHILANPVGEDDRPDVPRPGVDFAECPQCRRNVKLTRLGYFENHNTTLKGGERCLVSGVRFKHARKTETVPLPGDEPPKPGAERPGTPDHLRARSADTSAGASELTPTAEANLAAQPMEPSPESPATSKGSSSTATGIPSGAAGAPAESASAGEGPPVLHLAPLLGDGSVLQPFSYICQPSPAPVKVSAKAAMGPEALERKARFQETFFAYNNRRSSDNRGAQVSLGPSEIGHECDRRLAMSLMNIPRVNPGGDGWAAWKGTQLHSGMEDVFRWANANSGRYVTELRVRYNSQHVPKGTTDLYDRVLAEIVDFKFPGEYSLKKMIQEGPPVHYQVQLDVYGLGVELMGEKVRTVSLYALPAAATSLDGMYVWTKPYDRKAAQEALDRVDRIAAEAERRSQPMHPDGQWSAASKSEIAKSFEPGPPDGCRYCPFYLKGDERMERGCPGK